MGVIKFLPKIEKKIQLRFTTGCFVTFITSFSQNEGDKKETISTLLSFQDVSIDCVLYVWVCKKTN